MAFRLTDPRDVRADIRRLLAEQYERAAEALSDRNVHRVRTSCKRAVGVLRMVGRPDKDDLLGAMNDWTGAVGRAVGGARDDQVLIRTVRDLADRVGGVDVEAVIAALRVDRPGVAEAEADWGALADELAELVVLAARVECSKGAMWRAVARVYGRARDFMPESVDDSPERFHRWRTHAKRHWYQLRLLRPLWPKILDARSAEVGRLTEWVGEHHDLAVAAGRLAGAGAPCLDLLLAEARGRQTRLAGRALRVGSRAFSGSPADLVAGLRPLWKAWQRTG